MVTSSRFTALLFQGSLVKRIAIGLVLGIFLALISPYLEPMLGTNLAENVSILGQIFVRSLRSIAPILIFVLVIAAIANRKVGEKSNLKSIIYFIFIRHVSIRIGGGGCQFLIPDRVSVGGCGKIYRTAGKRDSSVEHFNF